MTRVQIKTQDQRIEKVFGEIETAFPFGVIFKVPVPVASFLHLAGVVSQMQRRQSLVRSDGRQSRALFHLSIDGAILVSGAVIVAECDQRPEFKAQILEPFRMIVFLQFVLHHGAVLTLDHEYGFLDLNALDFVSEDRKWIEAELLEVSKSLRVNYAGIAVCR